jgi:AGCS family alanine or glycine:cation symporter
VLSGVVILGGIRSIGRFTGLFVPVMLLAYCFGAIWVIVAHVPELPAAIGTVFSNAFTGTAATGGFAGALIASTIRYGVARGMFSNEAGLGSGAIAAAAAQTRHPVRQAMVSMTQTFIDTLVVVTCTGLAIVVTGSWTSGTTGAELTRSAFQAGLPGEWGGALVTLGICFFAYSTLIGWGYYGERTIERLLGRRVILPFRLLFVAAIYVGSVQSLETVWAFADIANGLMALPNLIGVLLLSGLVVRETRAFFARPGWRDLDDEPADSDGVGPDDVAAPVPRGSATLAE